MTGRRGEPEREGAGGKSWRVGEPPPQTDCRGWGFAFVLRCRKCLLLGSVSICEAGEVRIWYRLLQGLASDASARFDRVPGKGALNTAAQLHVPARVHWGSELVLGRRMR